MCFNINYPWFDGKAWTSRYNVMASYVTSVAVIVNSPSQFLPGQFNSIVKNAVSPNRVIRKPGFKINMKPYL